ncbi:GID complex subunit containing RING finger motif, partial [Ascosphaera acerosa]
MADASIRLVHAEHLHLEQSLLRIPNEHVGRNVRPSQKMTARESDNCLSTLGRLAADLPAGRASADDALAALDALVAGLQGLRHRLETLNRRDRTQLERTGKRLAHLRAFHAIGDTADARYADWARTRLNRLLVDHLTREGYQRSARRLAEETGLLDLVDLDTFEACNSIAAKLAAGDHAAALAWCSLNKDALKKKGLTELEFQLRLQQYIEMVRRRDFVAARAHAAKFLDPASDGERGEVVRQAAAMLVFGPETDSQPYK